MLDKLSEIILDYAISRYDSSDNYVDFNSYDAELLNIPIEKIVMVCEDLASNNYFTDFITYYDEGCRVRVTGKALAYSEHKRHDKFRFWFPIIITNLISVLALIVAILAYIKQ